jgi:hypothetical protein
MERDERRWRHHNQPTMIRPPGDPPLFVPNHARARLTLSFVLSHLHVAPSRVTRVKSIHNLMSPGLQESHSPFVVATLVLHILIKLTTLRGSLVVRMGNDKDTRRIAFCKEILARPIQAAYLIRTADTYLGILHRRAPVRLHCQAPGHSSGEGCRGLPNVKVVHHRSVIVSCDFAFSSPKIIPCPCAPGRDSGVCEHFAADERTHCPKIYKLQ